MLKMNNFAKEQRLSDRIILSSAKETKYPLIHDISIGGMQFSTPLGSYTMNIGEIFVITLSFPDSLQNNIWGQIRYIRNDTDQTSHYGVQFLKMNWPIWNRLAAFNKNTVEIIEIQKLPDDELEKITKIQQVASSNPTIIKLLTDKLLDVELENVNFGGVSLHVYEGVPIDSGVKVNFYYKKTTLTTEGVSVWCSNMNEITKSFLVGIRFKHLNQEQFYILSELVLELNRIVIENQT
jgi:hypothetical protein